jgi:cell division protein FtsB
MKTMSKKIAYSKLTFILSVIGFLGSLGFYFGVLREIYSEPDSKVVIERLEKENKELKTQVKVLTGMVDECKDE